MFSRRSFASVVTSLFSLKLLGAVPTKSKVQLAFEKLHKELLEMLSRKTNGCIPSLRGIDLFEDLTLNYNRGLYFIVDMYKWPIFDNVIKKGESLDEDMRQNKIPEKEFWEKNQDIFGEIRLKFAGCSYLDHNNLSDQEWEEVLKLFETVCKRLYKFPKGGSKWIT